MGNNLHWDHHACIDLFDGRLRNFATAYFFFDWKYPTYQGFSLGSFE
jgi:hypothetical protein